MTLTTIDELREKFPDSEWLEDKGQFSRVTTAPEESAWYCTFCDSLDVAPYDNICNNCGEN